MTHEDAEQEGRRTARVLACVVLAAAGVYTLVVAATVDDTLHAVAPDRAPAITASSVAVAALCLLVLVGAVLRWREHRAFAVRSLVVVRWCGIGGGRSGYRVGRVDRRDVR